MLNPSQQQAVDHSKWALLILAWAGAGKTHTLTERVAKLVEDGVPPKSILCVTFTNKAAREMRERILKRIGFSFVPHSPYSGVNIPLIGTFHSLGVYFLRLYGQAIGYEKNFVIYDEDDRVKIIKTILKSKDLDEKQFIPKKILGQISSAKNDMRSAESFKKSAVTYATNVIADIYFEYENALRNNNALDFDDILLKWLELVENPAVLDEFHKRFEHILVDEYQDTNDIQYRIIRKLALKSGNLAVVGDDWQGIYSWRGANIKNILSFQRDFAGATLVKLEQNYRSTQNIINAANTVIKKNTEALEKTLWTDNEVGEKITLFESTDEKDEAKTIAETIFEEGNFWSWAILYRTNGQSRTLEEALIRKNIAYKVYGGQKFYERKEIKDILSYLRFIHNPADIVSLARIINVPARKIGDKSAEALFDYMRQTGEIFSENLIHCVPDFSASAKHSALNFAQIIASVTQNITKNGVANGMKTLLEQTDYWRYLQDSYDEEDYLNKKENLNEFLSLASRYDGMEEGEGLSLFLEEIALITDSDRDDIKAHSYVSLMTVHLAKGLEFENVVIAGLEEGLFPHSRSLLEPKDMEEERRLMYVAMTRAKKRLYISRAFERFAFGSYSVNPPSRFIKEIPEEFVYKMEKATPIFSPASSASSFSFQKSAVPNKRTLIKNDPSVFKLGDRVKHVQFGVGTIVSIAGAVADIAFGNGYGIKKLNLELAPLERG